MTSLRPGDPAWALISTPIGRGLQLRRAVIDAAQVMVRAIEVDYAIDITETIEVVIIKGGRTIAGHIYRMPASDVFPDDARGRAGFEAAVRRCWASSLPKAPSPR